MSQQRRKCKLANTEFADVDLRNYQTVIINTVNSVIPGKHPLVFKEYFSTDPLTQSEAVSLGRALAKIETLNALGKTVTIFRLFDGKLYDSEVSCKPSTKNIKIPNTKGGRMR